MREPNMHERCVTQPMNAANMPAHQGIAPYVFVPSYMMMVGSGSYLTGHTWYPAIMQVDKPVYASKDVPFEKLSIDYHS